MTMEDALRLIEPSLRLIEPSLREILRLQRQFGFYVADHDDAVKFARKMLKVGWLLDDALEYAFTLPREVCWLYPTPVPRGGD